MSFEHQNEKNEEVDNTSVDNNQIIMNSVSNNIDSIEFAYDNLSEETVSESGFEGVSNNLYYHPVYKKYCINIITNDIYNTKAAYTTNEKKYTTIKLKSKVTKESYYKKVKITHSSVNKCLTFHRFKWECYHNKLIPEGYEIDHIDNNPNNNDITNLQCLDKKAHGKKTANNNPDRGLKVRKSQGLSGTAKNSQTGKIIKFESINHLAKLIKSSPGNIHRFLRLKKYPPMGYDSIILDIEKDSNYNQEDIWIDITDMFYKHEQNSERYKFGIRKIYLSDKGQIKKESAYDKFKYTYGYKEGDYLLYSGKRIHRLVMKVFGPPCSEGYDTVDHINGKTRDNNISNLRWANPKIQSLNLITNRNMKHLKINVYTGEIIKIVDFKNEFKSINLNYAKYYSTGIITTQFKTKLKNLKIIKHNIRKLFFKFAIALIHCNESKNEIIGLTKFIKKSDSSISYDYKRKPTKFCKKGIYKKRCNSISSKVHIKEYKCSCGNYYNKKPSIIQRHINNNCVNSKVVTVFNQYKTPLGYMEFISKRSNAAIKIQIYYRVYQRYKAFIKNFNELTEQI